MKAKQMYKVVDGKGRVLIPRELRAASGMDYGDIVRLGVSQGAVSVKKVELIEVGDQSPEAVEAFVYAAIRDMPEEKKIAIAAKLLEQLHGGKEPLRVD
jgi:bifunctional DNA-binding transcriptional regulator/antitoxin component of YhaV-PrlF toxin-antitoxin module